MKGDYEPHVATGQEKCDQSSLWYAGGKYTVDLKNLGWKKDCKISHPFYIVEMLKQYFGYPGLTKICCKDDFHLLLFF